MKTIRSKKGQGGDTFKLLIAAVVAMVILGIVTGVFQEIYKFIVPMTCVSSPIDEFVTKIQKSQTGIETSTDSICMKAGEGFTTATLIDKMANLNSLSFTCEGAAVCRNDNPISVSADSIRAVGEARFKGIITCIKSSGDYDCSIIIQSAG